ncbi:MAG: LITAF-like zinc ribbon domain-containing protein [Blastocatellia bacterium]
MKQPVNPDFQPPRPYAWKTDEYQTLSEPRNRSTPAQAQLPYQPQPLYQQQQMTYRGPQDMTANYRCPHCGTSYLPVMERRISTAGWVIFALLLVFTFIFFWVGLLMKEDAAICPVCRNRVN